MAWPQAPQPAPAPAAGGSPPLGALVTAGAGLLTFFFSFVQVAKIDNGFVEAGWSVWTTDEIPGFFGIGTFIPLFALVAAAAALAAAFAKGLADKSLAGFTLGQIQLVAVAFAVLLWFGYLVNAVIGDTEPGLGLLLLFVGLAGLVAGTVLSMGEAKKAGAPSAPVGGEAFPAQPQQHWSQPQPAPPAQPQWQQPQPDPQQWQAPPAQPQWQQPQPPADPQQWQQAQPPAWDQTVVHGAPSTPGQWQQPPAPQADPGQWQPPAGSPTEPQPWDPAPAPPGPQPEPGPIDPQPGPPVDPQPEPAGGLFDPGTQVIPGPPPAPPADDVNPQPGGPVGLPQPPPSNTP